MDNKFTLNLRAFTVLVTDAEGLETRRYVAFEKSQLQAAQLIGLSSDNLIKIHFEKQGYTVAKVINCDKKIVSLDLQALYTEGGASD